MPIPRNITKQDILHAISEIDKNSYDPVYESKNYVLDLKGKFYPPKYVVRLANKFANGKELDSSSFISHEAVRFLEALHFTIKKVSSSSKEPRGKTSGSVEQTNEVGTTVSEKPRKSDADFVLDLLKSVEGILEKLEPRGFKQDVANWITNLEKTNRIPRLVSSWMHGIRLARNEVIHKTERVLCPIERRALYADWAAIEEWWKGSKTK